MGAVVPSTDLAIFMKSQNQRNLKECLPQTHSPALPALPAELRLHIWQNALSVWSVWAAVRSCGSHAADCDLSANRPLFIMTNVGPAPHLVGLFSCEAWRLLKRSFKPFGGPRGVAESAGACWVDMGRTTVYLGDCSDATLVLDSFAADEVSEFKHVALTLRYFSYQFSILARACQRLANMCPALRTIIVQLDETEPATDGSLFPPMDLETAACFAKILEYTGPELGYKKLGMPYFRALLLEYFGDTPPRLHLLSTDSPTRPFLDGLCG